MKTTLKCPTKGCVSEVAVTDVHETSHMGGKLRLYEGECPEHGLFQEQEEVRFQGSTVELPPTGNIRTLKCPTPGCTQVVSARLTIDKRAMQGRLRMFEGECPEHGLFNAQQMTPYQR